MQSAGYKIKGIDVYEASRKKSKSISVILKCIQAFKSDNPVVYCLDSKRLKALLFLQSFFRKSLSRTTVLAIGGVFHETIAECPSFENKLKKVKSIWVETEGMREKLLDKGFINIEIFPNPKSEEGCCEPRLFEAQQSLRLVYFSQISREKGVEDIMEWVCLEESCKRILYQLDFYGHVTPDFEEEFYKFIQRYSNVNYCGIFDSTKQNVYKKLNEYDILLFPSHWDTEGVPGILVEAKMSGVAVIASNKSFNQEIICEQNNEGIILKSDNVSEMEKAINLLYHNRELLMKIKKHPIIPEKDMN